jgi:hypothetical protein
MHKTAALKFPIATIRAAPRSIAVSDRIAKRTTVLSRRHHARPKSVCAVDQPRYISRRPSMAFEIVTSSANSKSLPTGIPIAMRVTLTPSGFSSRAK